MYTKLKRLDHRDREHNLIPVDLDSKSRKSPDSRLVSRLKYWIKSVFANSHTPRIQRRYDAHGAPVWWVYDPLTGEKARFFDETAVRVWLEHRYDVPSRPRNPSILSSLHPPIWR